MPDACFAHPRLAAVYDTFDGGRDDLDHYVRILVDECRAGNVLDVGCGTGALATLLVSQGVAVTGVDPAGASVDIARGKPGAERTTWVDGVVENVTARGFDAAVMTGNVAQVFLDDDHWSATLRAIAERLRPGGALVFETRRPQARAWESWDDPVPDVRDVPGVGQVACRRRVTEVALPYVSFETETTLPDGEVLTSSSTLRFRELEELRASLSEAGFAVDDVRDAPDRPGLEYVVVARRAG